MQAEFLGVGEACDESLANTSVLVRTEGDSAGVVLLDCGFTVFPRLFSSLPDPESLDAVWISHFHGDHIFGLPLVLLRMWVSGRKKPLLIAGQGGIQDRVEEILDLAYPGLRKKMDFDLQFLELEPGSRELILDITWSTAQTGHSHRNLALRLESGQSCLYYSGDGPPSAESEDLAKGCKTLIHEAYTTGQQIPGHATVSQCLDLARRTGARNLALVHLQREERRNRREEAQQELAEPKDIQAWIAKQGEVVRV